MKTIIDVAASNTISKIEDFIMSVLRSRAHESRLGSIGPAVLTAVKSATGHHPRYGAVSKIVKNATVEMKAQPEVMSMVVDGLYDSVKLMSSIAKHAATTIRPEARRVYYVQKEKTRIEVDRPSHHHQTIGLGLI